MPISAAGLLLPLISVPVILWIAIRNPETLPTLAAYTVLISWLWATIPAMLYAEKEGPSKAVLAFFVGIFNLLALSWICVYSWITMRNSKWMTREVKTEAAESADTRTEPRIS